MITTKDIVKKRVKKEDIVYYYDERGYKYIAFVKDIVEIRNYHQLLLFSSRLGYKIVNITDNTYNSIELKEKY